MNVLEHIRERAKKDIKTIVFPEGTDERMVKAAQICADENLIKPILVGSRDETEKTAQTAGITLNVPIIDPETDDDREDYAQAFYDLRKHKGLDPDKAQEIMRNPLYFAAMMVRKGRADASVAGAMNTTGDVLRAAIQVIGVAKNFSVVSSTFLIVLPDGTPYTFADCGVMPNPDAQQLAEIAVASAETHKSLTEQDPIVAMLSFSTKGSAKHELVDKVIKATKLAQEMAPDIPIDGELQLDAAIVEAVGQKKAPESNVAGKANVLIFPDLQAGNIGYKLAERIGKATAIGPIIQGTAKPVNDLSRGCKVEDIVTVACICSLKAQKAS
jgi:phosphate acetyltransferase